MTDREKCPIDGCPWRYLALSGPVVGDDGYATDLAERYSVGELGILADIAASDTEAGDA